MKRLTRTIFLLLTFGALFSVASSALPGQAQTATICKCEDIAQIQYRIDEDNAAIDAYVRYEATVPHNLFNVSGAHAKLQAYVEAAMTAFANQPGRLTAPLDPGEQALTLCTDAGGTEPILPKYKVKPTPCLMHALELHEAVHRKECDDALNKPLTGKRTLLLTSYISEEIKAYTTEVDFLASEKKRLLCNCDYYALKYNKTVTFEDRTHPNIHETLHLASDAGDFVMIALNLSNGSFSGHGSGTDKLDTTATAPGFLSASSADEADSFDVDGRLSALTVLNVATTVQTVKGTETTQIGGVTVSGSGTKNPNYTFPPMPMQFTKVDDPFVLDRVSGSNLVAREHFESRIVVRDKWIGVRAGNGAGDTVDRALKAIGFVNC